MADPLALSITRIRREIDKIVASVPAKEDRLLLISVAERLLSALREENNK